MAENLTKLILKEEELLQAFFECSIRNQYKRLNGLLKILFLW